LNDGLVIYGDLCRLEDAFIDFCQSEYDSALDIKVAELRTSIPRSFKRWRDVTGRVLRLFPAMRSEYEGRGFDMTRYVALQQIFREHCEESQSSEAACDARIARLTGMAIPSVPVPQRHGDFQTKEQRRRFWATPQAEFTQGNIDEYESIRASQGLPSVSRLISKRAGQTK